MCDDVCIVKSFVWETNKKYELFELKICWSIEILCYFMNEMFVFNDEWVNLIFVCHSFRIWKWVVCYDGMILEDVCVCVCMGIKIIFYIWLMF